MFWILFLALGGCIGAFGIQVWDISRLASYGISKTNVNLIKVIGSALLFGGIWFHWQASYEGHIFSSLLGLMIGNFVVGFPIFFIAKLIPPFSYSSILRLLSFAVGAVLTLIQIWRLLP